MTAAGDAPIEAASGQATSSRRKKYGDGSWVRRLTLSAHGKPLHVLVITGGRPYINLTMGEDDRYVTSLSPAEWRRINAHVEAHLAAPAARATQEDDRG